MHASSQGLDKQLARHLLGSSRGIKDLDRHRRCVPFLFLLETTANPLSAYSAAMDFTLAALPWTFLFTLSMKTKEKIGVAVAMSMGVV
jgi:hypothetical protein